MSPCKGFAQTVPSDSMGALTARRNAKIYVPENSHWNDGPGGCFYL